MKEKQWKWIANSYIIYTIIIFLITGYLINIESVFVVYTFWIGIMVLLPVGGISILSLWYRNSKTKSLGG